MGVVDLSFSTSYTGKGQRRVFDCGGWLLVGYVEGDCVVVGACWFDGVGSGRVDDCARQNNLLYFWLF